MKTDCEVICDLLPLYADGACSKESCRMVEEHLAECPACSELLEKLGETEIEDSLQTERDDVIRYAVRRFRRRSAAVGSAVSGCVLVPVLACVILSYLFGPSVSWVSVVLAALCVPASLIAVPLLVREDKAFWTFLAFTASLMLLLGVACLYKREDWFWIASSSVLFGLSVVFLPFLIRARPLQKLIGSSNKALIVLGLDAALFVNMLNMLSSRGRVTLNTLLYTVVVIAGIALVVMEIIRHRKAE